MKKYRISTDSFKIKVKNLGPIENGEYSIEQITLLTESSNLRKYTSPKAMHFAIKIYNEYEKEIVDRVDRMNKNK